MLRLEAAMLRLEAAMLAAEAAVTGLADSFPEEFKHAVRR
jgi:hypothetical protein